MPSDLAVLADAELAANKASSLFVRFLDEQAGGNWIERVGTNGIAIKRHPDRNAATIAARKRSRVLPIVVRNASSVPTELV
jgi:hypothetical protein